MRTAHSTAPHAAPPQRRSAAPQTWDIPSRPPASTRSAAHRTARRGRPPRRPAAYVPGAIPRGALALSIRNNWEQEFFSTRGCQELEFQKVFVSALSRLGGGENARRRARAGGQGGERALLCQRPSARRLAGRARLCARRAAGRAGRAWRPSAQETEPLELRQGNGEQAQGAGERY